MLAAAQGRYEHRYWLRLWYDADQVEALSADRDGLWERVRAADFLTINEKRAATGYAPVADGDRFSDIKNKP